MKFNFFITLLIFLLISCKTNQGEVIMQNEIHLTHFKNIKYQREYMANYSLAMKDWPVNFDEHYIDNSYGTTYIIESGNRDKPKLILLHWFSFNSTIWIPMIEELSNNYHIFAVDIMGDMGKSNMLIPIETDEDIAKWGSEVINGLGLEKVILAGFSNGGYQAATIARIYPDLIDKLILLAPAATIDNFSFTFFKTVIGTALFPTTKNVDRFIDTFSAYPERWKSYSKIMLKQAFKGSKIQVKVYPRLLTPQEMRNISMPTLLILGSEERIYNPIKAIKNANQNIPNLTVELIDDCSHAITIDQPDKAVKLIHNFVIKN